MIYCAYKRKIVLTILIVAGFLCRFSNLLEFAKAKPSKVIYFSSLCIYVLNSTTRIKITELARMQGKGKKKGVNISL
jgi:hypothetical protein